MSDEKRIENVEIENPTENVNSEQSVEELKAELAKMKSNFDKASSEAAEYKKKYKATLTEKEQENIAKAEKEAEREAQLNSLLRENSINKLEKNFVLLGYTEEQANKAATAQHDGDTETLFKIQSEVQQALLKAKESEWLKSRPPVNSGGTSNNEDDPFLKGFNS